MSQSVGSIIQVDNDDTDYFLSIGAFNTSYSELIDFKKKEINRVLTSQLYAVKVFSEIGTIFESSALSTNQKKYYIISFLTEESGNIYNFMIKLYNFYSINMETGNTREAYKYQSASKNKKIVSCFETYPSNYIYCFFVDNSNSFTVNMYQPTLNLQIVLSKSIDTTLNDAIHEDIFMKAIHLTENAGIFIYYKSFYYAYPIIQIKEWDGYSGLNNFKSF